MQRFFTAELLLKRRDRAEHAARLLRRAAFNFAVLFELSNNGFHYFLAFIDVSHLASAKLDGDLHFVVVLQKANGLLDLKLNIMLARFRTDANFFQLRLVLLAFGCSFAFVVLELSIVHNTAHRRLCLGSNFDQIKPLFASLGKRVSCGDNAQLFSFTVNHADGRDADRLVNAVLW